MGILSLSHVTKRYGSFRAVEDVSFSIERGEVVGFVGLNGAGKSTTINALLGFLQASEGTIEVFGRNITPQTAHKTHDRLGFASGDMALFENLTGNQYFSFIAHQTKHDTAPRLKELIERFEPDVTKKIGELSRGNRQKVALIGAFMSNPELVILDEPSSGLDPLMQQHFIQLIREEAEKGTTVFMSSHYLNEVVDVCTRVLLIKNGKLIKDVPADELLDGGGKFVRLLSKGKMKAPRGAELVMQDTTPDGELLTFVFKGKPVQLQTWLGGVTNLIDISITEHDAEAAFGDLYEEEATNA